MDDHTVITELSLYAVFLTGLLGGVHCAGMCGGIVSALGMMRQRTGGSLRGISVSIEASASTSVARQANAAPSALLSVSLYNLGRLSTYTALGAMAGAVGSFAWMMNSMLPVQQIAYLISSLLLLLMGLYVMGEKRIATVLTRSGVGNSILAGSLWGLVPCGMVYAVLSASLVSGNATNGALLMLVFGLGTLPNLMLLGMSGQWLAKASRNLVVRRCAGLLIIGFGVAGLVHLAMMRAQ